MTDDWLGNSSFGSDDDAVVFYGIPGDHPAFGGQGDDDESDGSGGNSDPIGSNVLQLPVGRYDGYGDEGDQDASGVPRTSDPRQRAAVREQRDRKNEQRANESGTRSVREHAVAKGNSGGDKAGERDSGSGELHAQLAASLEAAGIRFRDEPRIDGADHAAIELATSLSAEVLRVGGTMKPTNGGPAPLVRSSRGVTKAPDFKRAVLEGQMGGLKSNAGGTWILTLAIDPDYVEEVTKLGRAHGLALKISIERKSRD